MFERCNDQLGKHAWIAGDTRSIADTYLFVTVMWTHLVNVDISGLDHVKAFERRMRADKGVRNSLKAQGLDKAHAA